MKPKRLTVIGVLFGGIFLFVALVWAVSSNGPYYALPAWDQKLAASTRFVVLTDWNNEAVLDRETGLVWERTLGTTYWPWNEARGYCLEKAVGGRRGWRLPGIAELLSLIDPSVPEPGPRLPPGHPFLNVPSPRVQSHFYWSATTLAVDSMSAWHMDISDGTPHTGGKGPAGLYVWCVRGPMNADVY